MYAPPYEQCGWLEVETRPLPLGQGFEPVAYRLVGGPFVQISRHCMDELEGKKVGDIVVVGPYRLRLLVEDWLLNGFWARQDGWQAWLDLAWFPVKRWFLGIYYRLIITLSVWGLASYREAALPHWRQVYALAALARWLGR